MDDHPRISPDGGVTIPAEQIAREGWTADTELEAVRTGGGILVRPKRSAKGQEEILWEEFHRRVPPHEGPPVILDDMNRAIDLAMAERWAAK